MLLTLFGEAPGPHCGTVAKRLSAAKDAPGIPGPAAAREPAMKRSLRVGSVAWT